MEALSTLSQLKYLIVFMPRIILCDLCTVHRDTRPMFNDTSYLITANGQRIYKYLAKYFKQMKSDNSTWRNCYFFTLHCLYLWILTAQGSLRKHHSVCCYRRNRETIDSRDSYRIQMLVCQLKSRNRNEWHDNKVSKLIALMVLRVMHICEVTTDTVSHFQSLSSQECTVKKMGRTTNSNYN